MATCLTHLKWQNCFYLLACLNAKEPKHQRIHETECPGCPRFYWIWTILKWSVLYDSKFIVSLWKVVVNLAWLLTRSPQFRDIRRQHLRKNQEERLFIIRSLPYEWKGWQSKEQSEHRYNSQVQPTVMWTGLQWSYRGKN